MLIKSDNKNYIEFIDTPWNSKVLGFKTNEITQIRFTKEEILSELMREFEEFSCSNNYFFSGIRIQPENLTLRKVLTKTGYNQVETIFELTKKFDSIKYSSDILETDINLRIAEESDTEKIVDIVRCILHHGRFFEDPKIDNQIAVERNINWVKSFCDKKTVFAGEFETDIIGFLAFDINKDLCVLQLGGVKEEFNFLAYPFWLKSFIYLHELYNVTRFNTIISAYNLPIIALYNYFGFIYKSVSIGFHKHRSPKDDPVQ